MNFMMEDILTAMCTLFVVLYIHLFIRCFKTLILYRKFIHNPTYIKVAILTMLLPFTIYASITWTVEKQFLSIPYLSSFFWGTHHITFPIFANHFLDYIDELIEASKNRKENLKKKFTQIREIYQAPKFHENFFKKLGY